MTDENSSINEDTLVLAAEIVSAYASNNQISKDDLPALIESIHSTLRGLGNNGGAEAAADVKPALVPAVPIDASVTEDAIICLEDGKPFKTLKRHLRTAYNMSPEEYRERWGLSKDYPLVAPSYSKKRAATAKKIGLGRKPAAAKASGGKAASKKK